MTPPTFSKPKPVHSWAETNKRDYKTTFTTRRPKREPTSGKRAGWEPEKSLRSDWIDCPQDRAEVLAILKRKEGK